MQELGDKVALVTGAGSGIGRAAAVLFAARGAKVAAADVDADAVADVVREITAAGGEAEAIICDVSKKDAVIAMVDRVVERFGKLDCAFNNAGITHPADAEWDDEGFRLTLDVNLHGVMQCMKQELRFMVPQGCGASVNMSSIGGMIATATPSLPGYVASKHAVIGLTKVAALKHARDGIRVNAIMPGTTLTNLVKSVMELGPEVRQALENSAPMGRLARPEEIAEAAVWLCSDRASFVTGHALAVDGGYLAQ